jgi:hypothetical protein
MAGMFRRATRSQSTIAIRNVIVAAVVLWAALADAEERGRPFTLVGTDEGWVACQSQTELYVLAAIEVHNWGAMTKISEPSDCTRIHDGTKLELLERSTSRAFPMLRDDIIRVRVPDDYPLPPEMPARDQVWMQAAAFDGSQVTHH